MRLILAAARCGLARFQICRQQNLRRQFIEPGFALFLGEFRGRQHLLRFDGGERSSKNTTGTPVICCNHSPNLPRLDRFLTFAAIQMHRQADDKRDNLFFAHQPLKVLRIGHIAAARVIFQADWQSAAPDRSWRRQLQVPKSTPASRPDDGSAELPVGSLN